MNSPVSSVAMAPWWRKSVNDNPERKEIPEEQRTELSVVLYGVRVNEYKKDTSVVITFSQEYEETVADEIFRSLQLKVDSSK